MGPIQLHPRKIAYMFHNALRFINVYSHGAFIYPHIKCGQVPVFVFKIVTRILQLKINISRLNSLNLRENDEYVKDAPLDCVER